MSAWRSPHSQSWHDNPEPMTTRDMSRAAINKRIQQRKKARKKLEREHVKAHGWVPMNPKVKPKWEPAPPKPQPVKTYTADSFWDRFRW